MCVSYGENQDFFPRLVNDLERKLVEKESAEVTAVPGPALWSILNLFNCANELGLKLTSCLNAAIAIPCKRDIIFRSCLWMKLNGSFCH